MLYSSGMLLNYITYSFLESCIILSFSVQNMKIISYSMKDKKDCFWNSLETEMYIQDTTSIVAFLCPAVKE